VPRWEDFLQRLAPLPERPHGKAFAACVIPATIPASGNAIINRLYPPANTSTRWDRRFNSENVELDCIYPFGLAGLGTADHAKAVAAYEGRPFASSYGWDWSPVCAARLGLGEEAARLLAEHCRNTQHWPQGFWDSPSSPYWAGGLVDCPYFDSAGVNAAATTEMLLQSHGGILRVWPAVPASWSGAFSLRAETGFTVTSERSGGVVSYVAVESLFGGPCRLVNPWSAKWRVTCRDQTAGKTVAEGEAGQIAFPTETRRTYLIERAAAPVDGMAFRRLEPQANADVKYMANSRRARRPLAPTPGLPMLGITSSGLTPARAAAAENRAGAARAIHQVIGDRKPRTGLTARWLDAGGRAAPAPWIADGKYGAATIPLPRVPACGYLLELPAQLPVFAVVWSYDRTGQRQDVEGHARALRIECSRDGTTWTQAAAQEVQAGDRHGKAVLLPDRAEARYVRLRFLDGAGKPGVLSCDEIEVF